MIMHALMLFFSFKDWAQNLWAQNLLQAGCGIQPSQVGPKFEYFSHADLLSKKVFLVQK